MRYSEASYIGIGKVPIGMGAVLRGWDITEEHFRNADRLPVVDFRAMGPQCPHNCWECYTDKLKKTLTLVEIKRVIDQLADMGTHAIDYLGEGEPTLDPDFFAIIEYTARKGIIPVVFTEAAAMMRERDFISRVFDSGASVIPKCNSLWNKEYQNWAVRDKSGRFFDNRNEAIGLLITKGFSAIASDGTTRLGFDMVVSSRNIHEVERTLRYCRSNNLWVLFSFHLPAGRSGSKEFDKALVPTLDQKTLMRETVHRVDQELGYLHPVWSNFATMPCVERLQIFGDGRVSPCPGNETIIGYVQNESIRDLHKKLLERFPGHDPKGFDGHCLYRSGI